MSATEWPMCSCRLPMVQMAGSGYFQCAHCDGRCTKPEAHCDEHRRLAVATTRKHETTAPPKEMRKDK